MKCIQGHGGGLGKYGWRMGRHEFQFLNGLFMFFWTVLSMDLKTALQNMKNQFNTYGVIRVAGYDNSISPLKSKVIEIEFSTDEIDEIERK